MCIKNDGFAPDNDCNEAERPITLESCKIETYKDCQPKWHYAEWTEVGNKLLLSTDDLK